MLVTFKNRSLPHVTSQSYHHHKPSRTSVTNIDVANSKLLVSISYIAWKGQESSDLGFKLSERFMLGHPNPYTLNEEFNTDMSPRPGTQFEFLNTQYHRCIFKSTQFYNN